ncbi:MAG: sigma-70 family RNA polymerase sigma factor [Verrucomicrobiota bacterium]
MDESTRQVTRLWTLAQPRIAAFVTSMLRDFRDRDDLMQDIAVAVFESFDSYDSSRPFDKWALGVARNQFKNYLRKRKRDHSRLVFDDETVECVEEAFAAESAEELHKLDHLKECLNELEGRGRELCELRYEDELKPAAISEKLSMPGTAVRKALQRIREQLRNCVERKAAAEGGAA